MFEIREGMIEYKLSCKCLGLTIDNRLSWQEHTKTVCDSFSKKVSVLKRKFLPKSVLQAIYYRTILPSVLNGIVVWGSCSQSLLDDIDRIQKQKLFTVSQSPMAVRCYVRLCRAMYVYM